MRPLTLARFAAQALLAYLAAQSLSFAFELPRAYEAASDAMERWSMMRESCERVENYKTRTCREARALGGTNLWTSWVGATVARMSPCVVSCEVSASMISTIGSVGVVYGVVSKFV